ncbi:AAA family ATPase [Clostridium estertheticum]|uniref:AAA family ATPase n=1 Tax=Clostridium estertheticum TaxID=238834 RepID=A0AA47ELK4_9CLOT|nr:AAA family ATPase [Clostridium estertheticum]MBU3153423.1 AAA family ATPase [Clostridium estertheticum]WAG60828.1 AAA family ATPase [Clostridium estertheticum]
MKITQLDIRDFGVFQGEKLEELGNGIIVVGGANRSGKTTLMEILRNIPFGFSKGSKLPPPKFQYDVRCDLSSDEGEEVNVLLKGFSNPEVVYRNAQVKGSNKGVYDIDKGTYKELFTISLDELNKSSDKEDSNLQSMLLGAGFKHIVKIPGVAKELRQKANVIGGTRGNPATKMFKPFDENIKKGLEGRKRSTLLLTSYMQKKNSLSCLEDNIILKERQLLESDNNLIKLELLKHNYELNEKKENLIVELQTYFFGPDYVKEYNIEGAENLKIQYIKELEKYNNDNYEFQRETAKDELVKVILMENKRLIISYYNGISGIKEISKNLIRVKTEYYEKTGTIMNKIKKANDNWINFDDVTKVCCDEMQQHILNQNIEKYKKIKVDKINLDKKIEDSKMHRDVLEKQIAPRDSITYMKKYLYITMLFMIIGVVLFFIDKMLGCSIITIGALGTALYLFINYSNRKLIVVRNTEIKTQLDNIIINSKNNSHEIKKIDANLKELNNIMDEYRDILKLDEQVSVDGIKDYFKTVAYLKDEIFEYYLLKKKLMDQFDDLCETLNNIGNLLNKFTFFNTKSLGVISSKKICLDNIDSICSDLLLKIETLYKNLISLEKVDMSFSKLKILEKEILDFLCKKVTENIISDIEKYINNGEKYKRYKKQQDEFKIIQEKLLQSVKSHRIKDILHNVKHDALQTDNENQNLLNILQELYNQYISIDELNYDYKVSSNENKELIGELDILKNEKQTLKDEVTALNSDEMLLQYEKDIIEARGKLRPLAEKYAVYNTAALFLEKIRERFLENTKDKLLKGASNILSEITSGEYKDIMPQDDLMQGDFKTKLWDESIKESSKELSRGTKEQLFLAVRISRIKEIKPRLPVIFDDSFVNFDIAHTKNTVKALVELSKTNQIFVLTCHAALIEIIMAKASNALYFKLDKGKFTKSSGENLKEYLKEL